MGKLSFSDLDSTPLGDSHALTLGRWHLERDAGNIGGAFSLVWRRTGRGWLILHDHTTQSQPGP
jgi:ketosteroid isomerase-like protein